ncbi:Lrp/AsnC family transcriptional regulator [Bacillus sp. 03113]|uniref:Lrp/AsnC family transcriptional regulator n=1 Tax=Bacillus sp. 03113 TaxID=2578211 RepID=UPI001142E430|nr:Lrp/AsnC family transcriptional regulator [Bacillus sp. 03113]
MDNIDQQLIELLQNDGRMTVSDLSKQLSLSRPSISERLFRLQDKGIIERFSAIVSPKAVGRDTLLFIQISELKTSPQEFEEFIKNDVDILECHRVTGPVSHFLKAAVGGMEGLQMLVDRLIPFGNINTSIALKSAVEHRNIIPINKLT